MLFKGRKKYVNQRITISKHNVKNVIFLEILGVLFYGCIRDSYSKRKTIDSIDVFYILSENLNRV